jgi:N6-L-threonylcarbamoyladenine synthase
VQHSIVSILMKKLKRAAVETGINEIAIAGGVSANSELRKQLKMMGEQLNWNTYIPDFQYCTDNAGMIAITAYHKFLKSEFCAIDIPIQARLLM